MERRKSLVGDGWPCAGTQMQPPKQRGGRKTFLLSLLLPLSLPTKLSATVYPTTSKRETFWLAWLKEFPMTNVRTVLLTYVERTHTHNHISSLYSRQTRRAPFSSIQLCFLPPPPRNSSSNSKPPVT